MLASTSANVSAKSPEAFRTISEVSTELDVPQHVLRFWEGRFAQIKPVKRAGGRRYYRPEDVDLLRGIRALLYLEGFTIKGAQKILRDRGLRYVAELGRGETGFERQAPRKLAEFIASFGLSQFWLLFWLMVFYIILGCFLDGISMVVLTMGVILPTIQKAGIDLVWFGIFIVLVVEMAQITPPVGFNLFVLQGMTKREITWIARAALPLFFLMIVAVGLLYFFPALVTWLPARM